MSEPRVDPTFGISLGDVLIRPKRHPACRRREAQPGSCKERENLAGDAKGKGTSGSNRKAESTDAPERGGLLRSVRCAAHESGGLKSLRRSNEGCCILMPRRPAGLLAGRQVSGAIRNPKGLRRSIGAVNRMGQTPDEQVDQRWD